MQKVNKNLLKLICFLVVFMWFLLGLYQCMLYGAQKLRSVGFCEISNAFQDRYQFSGCKRVFFMLS